MKRNTSTSVASVAALAATLLSLNAVAQEADPHGFSAFGPSPTTAVAGKSRAQVRAELDAAIARGELNRTEADPHGFNAQRGVSSKTRDEVRADARRAKPVSVFVYPVGA